MLWMTDFSHVDPAGAARMVDVTDKDVTVRRAVATARLTTTREVVAQLRTNAVKKGDAVGVARIAGIMAAKRVPDLIPLCHPIAIHSVDVDIELSDDSVLITATVGTADRTGVEMEALTAVSVGGLALYDMIKAVDPGAVLGPIQVESKDGGRTGSWQREGQ